MKKVIFIFLAMVLFLSFKEPVPIHWYSAKEGIELSRRENKPVFLFVYVDWCDRCQRMDKKVFTNKAVQPLIIENFIPVKLNPEKDTALFLHNDNLIDRKLILKQVSKGAYGIAVPRTIMFNEKAKTQLVLEGSLDPEELSDSIQKFLKP